MQLAGIVAILGGIILVSLENRESRRRSKKRVAAGVGYALVAFLSLGFFFFALKFVVGDLGALVPALTVRLMSALVLTVALICCRNRTRGQVSSYVPLVIAIGVVDTLGNLAYNWGILTGAVSVVAPISGLFTAVTVLLAFAVLKERLRSHQLVGILAILIGVLAIGYLS